MPRPCSSPTTIRASASGSSEQDYSDAFIERLIVPQASAVWSADPRQMWSFPARFLCEFFGNHGMFDFRDRPRWRTVTGGSRAYVSALIAPFRDRVRLSTPVVGVERFDDGVAVTARGSLGAEYFDAVVIATHSDQALAMLTDPSDPERELLGAIPYQRNEAVLHTDRSLLPRRRRAWASWNYHLGGDPGRPTVTYHMNRLQSLSADVELCVTLNRTEAIDPDKIVRKIEYSASGVHARRRGGAGAPSRDQRCQSDALLRRVLGLGIPRGRRCQRPAGGRRARRRGADADRGMTASAIYEGTIRHRRFAVEEHEFRHRVAMAYVDLDELNVVPWRLRRRDYLGDADASLADAARALVRERVARRRQGRFGF